MIRHYYTLVKLTEELQLLKGFRIIECFTQEKNSLVMFLYDDYKEYYLCFSGDSKIGGLYIRDDFSRARKNSLSMFENISGRIIKDIMIVDNERIIQIILDDYIVNIILFGGSKSNIIITDYKGDIVDSFKNKKKLSKEKFTVHNSDLKSIDEFQSDSEILRLLSDCDLLLGKYYSLELCKRLNINSKSTFNDIQTKKDEIKSKALELKYECLNSKVYYILENENEEKILSLIRLSSHSRILKEFNKINDAVRFKIISSFKETSFTTEIKKIKPILEKQKLKLEKSLEQLFDTEKFNERIEKYKTWAGSLQSLGNMKERVGNTVDVILWDESKITVPLNPKFTIRENIDTYYQKIKDSKEEEKIRLKRIPIIKNKIDNIKSALIKLDLCANLKDIEIFKIEYRNILKSTMDELQKLDDRFRNFELADGYVLYVGKNAANNDELTMHFAKPNDIWLHARGAGGSHCVLKLKSKDEKPPKQILQKAAEITAYYSQARKGKFVPVAYTQKKYVHKPKGAEPGAVIISKEQVIMVEPKIPSAD
ncbi:MAG: DUF814 domain-containing protein [Ignavibacteriae bacterium]|nr:DUF814 domain-containing protein [Ignavibacteriota bacterium]